MVFNKNDKYAHGSLSLIHSDDENDYDGAPVAHLILSSGSDENTEDLHIILAVSYYEPEMDINIKLMSMFATMNDGPNDTATVYSVNYELKKYDKKTKSYQLID